MLKLNGIMLYNQGNRFKMVEKLLNGRMNKLKIMENGNIPMVYKMLDKDQDDLIVSLSLSLSLDEIIGVTPVGFVVICSRMLETGVNP